jgi:hypothetical protein
MAKTVDPYYEWLGIPPRDQPPNHYRLLGVELFEENRSVIDAAANRQMSFIKAYQAGEDSELSQKLLNELSTARLCLLMPEKKAAYDAELRAAITAREPAAPPAGPAGEGRWRSKPVDRLPPPGTNASATERTPSWPVPTSLPVSGRPAAPEVVERRAKQQRRSLPKNWMIAAAAGALLAAVAVLLGLVVATAVRWRSERSDQTVAKEPQQPVTDARPAPEMPPAPPSPETPEIAEPDPEPSPPSPETAETAEPERVPPPPTEPISPPGQPVLPPEAEPAEDPGALPPAETWEEVEARLGAAEQASSPAELRVVVHQALDGVDRAILDSQAEVAQRLATLALRAARKGNFDAEAREATLLLIELDEPLTDVARTRARQRLTARVRWRQENL